MNIILNQPWFFHSNLYAKFLMVLEQEEGCAVGGGQTEDES